MAKTTKRTGRKAPAAKRAPDPEAIEKAADERAAEESIDEVEEDCDSPWDIADIRAEYEAGFNRDRDNQNEAYLDLKYVAGDPSVHWDPDAWQQRTDESRPALIVNQCPQFVRQVTGDIRQMRPAIKVMPVDDQASKELAAKELPSLIRYVERRSDAAGIYFAASDQAVGGGIGHWMVTHEYASQRTFQQELRIVPVADGIAVVWDPDSVLLDRSDADFVFVPWDMSSRAFKKKYKGKNAAPFSASESAAFHSWASDDHVRVALYFRKRKCTMMLAVMPDGKVYDVTDDDTQAQALLAQGAKLKEREGHKVFRLVVSAHEILEEAEEWPGPDLPVVPMIGEEIIVGRQVTRRGVVRVLRDVQRIYNYAISTQTEIVALQPKAPFIGTRKQFEKYQEQWETANSRNWPYLEYTPDGQAPPPQRAQPPAASPGLDDLMGSTQNAMNSATGIYPPSLGQKSNEVSGKAIMARQREGDTGTYVYIDAFGRAVQRTGQIIINMAPKIYDTARRLQIAGEDGKPDELNINQAALGGPDGNQPITLNDLTVGAYEVAIEMGPSFSTKREEAREGMNELMRALGPESAQMFLDLFVKAQDFPLADKIAERARMLLPPNIRDKEDAESGKPPEPPAPPPPPTPEQIQQQKDEQAAMLDRQEAEANANRKHELDKLQIGVKQDEIALQLKQLEQKAREIELAHEQTMAQHAVTAAEATAQASADPRIDQIATLVESLTKSVEDLANRVDELTGEIQQTGQAHEVFAAEQRGLQKGAASAPPAAGEAAPAAAAPPPVDLSQILAKLSRRPTAAVRTKDGMRLLYDDEEAAPTDQPVA
jgi:hypothetical protein